MPAGTCQQGMLTLPDTWFRPPFLVLAYAPIVETRFPDLADFLSHILTLLDFYLAIPSVLSRFCFREHNHFDQKVCRKVARLAFFKKLFACWLTK